ncbi:D-arabinitol 2-dehydrogenase [Phlyctema vagabunda]|uniref:D-arabinitol 2-dehydrogenase n=1 Tax=Phlyctema vagabunda TaxID=108571 RepID=A0ABR4PQE2_9HELO
MPSCPKIFPQLIRSLGQPLLATRSSIVTTRKFQQQHNLRQESQIDRLPKGKPVDESNASNSLVSRNGNFKFIPTLPSFSLAEKVAVITGGARGLGLAMSQALVMSGADLAIVDINKEEAIHQAQVITKMFQKTYPDQKTPNVTAHYADVSLKPEVDKSIAEILTLHSRIDNLVTCAGFCENCDAISFAPERMRRMLGVNVEGTYFFATAVARHLIERRAPGNMVFIGSISGSIVNVPQPQALYNASKAAVRHLAASLAVEWAEKGIRVNCLSPGYMLTEIALKARILVDNPGLKAEWESKIPQRKMGAPEELMGAVTFLSSDASRYITGQEIKVDGGYTVC